MQFNKALKHTIIFKSLNTAFTFAINILLVRLLGADRSGQFFYAVTVLSFVTLVTGLCLENGITYYISRHPMAAMALTGYIAAALLVQAFISWFVIVQLHLSLPVTYQLLLVVSLLAINYFAALLTSRKWIVPVNSIVCTINFVTAGILFFLYFSNAHIVTINEVPAIYIASFVLQALLLIIVFFFYSRNDVVQKKRDAVKVITRFSLMVFAANLLYFLMTRIDYYFVEKHCTPAGLSNYIQASKLGQLFLLVPLMAGTILFPYTSGGNVAAMATVTKRLCRIMVTLFAIAAVIIAATGYWLFPWLFGAAFSEMYIPMLLLLPGILCLMIVTVISAYLDGINQLKTGITANVITLLIIAVADWLLIPVYGINAAAAISTVGYFICMLVTVHTFLKASGGNWAELLLITKNDVKNIMKE